MSHRSLCLRVTAALDAVPADAAGLVELLRGAKPPFPQA